MATVAFEGAGKVYDDGTRALRDFHLEIADGEFMVLVGPSGCGKTTALRMVAGLEAISEGVIRIGDLIVNALEPRKRDIAMVFQNYALYPHMSVHRNIAFGLKMRNVPRETIGARVENIARVLGIAELLDRKPRALSGGQRQRVAMGRAIVREPQAFLMDEPLSNLDAKLRVQMRAEIARIQRELGATTIYVTHDQVEAMTMGDRVCVLRKGELQQVDTPRELYEHPRSLFVASFIGSPPMNLVQATLERSPDGVACRVGDQVLAVPAARPELQPYVGRTIGLGIRPEHVHDAELAADTQTVGRLRGRVVTTELLGAELLAHVEVAAEPVVTQEVLEVAGDADRTLIEDLKSEAREGRVVFVGRYNARSRVRAGDDVEMVVETPSMHFFDLETEAAIGAPGEAA